MMHRIFTALVVVPVAVVLVAIAVANRIPVVFTLDPFNPGNPALSAEVPLFVLLLLALALGLVAGSTITWFKQRKYRKLAREHRDEPRPAAQRRDAALSGPGG